VTPDPASQDAAGVVPALFRLYYHRGEVLERSSGYQPSLDNYRAMGRLAAALGERAQLLRARIETGYRLTLLGRYDEALAVHRDAAAELDGGEIALRSRNWQCLAIVLRLLGRYEEALDAHRRAAQGDDDEARVHSGKNSLGHTLWRMGRYDEAVGCFREMLAWAESHSLIIHEATAHNNLGLVYADMERLAEARTHHEKALRLRTMFHDAGAVCSSYLNLGNILVQQDDAAGGVALWGRAREISRRLGDAATEAMIENNLGEVAYNAGDYPAALAHFGRSLAMKEALNLRSYLASSLEGLAKTHYELRADPAHRELCRRNAQRLLALDAARPRQQQTAREILDSLGDPEPGPKPVDKAAPN
jgi:tetratricopeptide (TPR) repeat protein